MSNKTRLQTNNTNLQELINKAENLPDAGDGGGSVETCTIRFVGSDREGELPIFLYYTKPDLSVGVVSMTANLEEQPEPIEVTALKHSTATVVSETACYGGYLIVDVSGDAENALGIGECTTVLVNGDCYIGAFI